MIPGSHLARVPDAAQLLPRRQRAPNTLGRCDRTSRIGDTGAQGNGSHQPFPAYRTLLSGRTSMDDPRQRSVMLRS